MSVNSRLKATKIIGQRKAFYIQSIRITSRAPSKKGSGTSWASSEEHLHQEGY